MQAQHIICALVITGTPISAIVLTTLIVNSRFFFVYDIITNYKDYGIWNRLALSSLLTDRDLWGCYNATLKRKQLMTDGYMD